MQAPTPPFPLDTPSRRDLDRSRDDTAQDVICAGLLDPELSLEYWLDRIERGGATR